jgi:hypothetical protein
MAIAIALSKKKQDWKGNWDKLFGILQSKTFKKAIENDIKREDKIKEDSQLFQIRNNKKQAKEKAKKGKSTGKKFFCKNHPEANTHDTEDCRMEKH